MLKIICTVTNDLNYDQRMHRICNSLQGVGYDVLLVGREKRNSIDLVEKSFKQKRINCWFEKGKLFYLEYNLRLLLFLLSSKFDVVYSVDLDTVIPGNIVARLKNKKQVFDAHEYFTELPELENRPFVKKIWLAIERHCIPKIEFGITVNNSISDYYKATYCKKFETIFNVPLREDSADEMEFSNEKFILYQGAVNKGRGFLELIKAIESTNITLKIAGNGDEFNHIKEYVINNKLENKVQLLGFVEPSELKKLTKNAFIGINLLDSNSKNYYYSLANKFFDYIHAGIPQISMNFPEYKSINNKIEVAVLINDLSAEAIQEAINKLLDVEYYQSLKQNCLLAKEQYNWQKDEIKLLNLMKKLHS